VLATQPRPLCVVMVESARAMNELPATVALAGVDGIYVGPRDLSYSLGTKLDPNDPVLRRAFEQIWAECDAVSKPVGVHATDGVAARHYRENGCRLITVVADTSAISRTTTAELATARA
jgi:4-hydroxy-2-oxoheptanedioate aldolase